MVKSYIRKQETEHFKKVQRQPSENMYVNLLTNKQINRLIDKLAKKTSHKEIQKIQHNTYGKMK